MTLLVVGLNHKTAPVALREKLACAEHELPHALDALLAKDEITQAVIVSTCNRTEVYASAITGPRGYQAITEFFAAYRGLDDAELDEMKESLYVRQGEAMIENLFRVAASLDSLVLGEAQILGQVRRAFLTAEARGATKEVFSCLFRKALEVGKLARSETEIGSRSVSVSTVAVNQAEQIFGTLAGREVLILGAGEMAELTLTYLRERGVGRVVVANRTLEHGRDLVARIGGTAISLDGLEAELAQADIVISSIFAPGYVIDRPMMERVSDAREGKAILIIDIALPRNIDPDCVQAEGVYCHDLDDLGAIIDEHRHEREIEAAKAEELVQREVASFLLWLQERQVVPTIKAIYQKADTVCDREVSHAVRELAKVQGRAVSAEEQAVLEALAASVSKKILHGPVIRMRKQAANPDAYIYTESARFLFGLDSNPLGLPCGHRVDHCAMNAGHTCSVAVAGSCPFGRVVKKDEVDA